MESPTIVIASLDSKQLENSINSILKTVEQKTNEMAGYFNTAVNTINQKLKDIGSGTASGGSSGTSKQVTEMKDLEVQTKKTTEAVKEKNATLDQQAQAQQQAVASATKYTDEVLKQAKVIRDMQSWKEKGYAMVGENVYYDPEKSTRPAKYRLSLEEQILRTQKDKALQAEILSRQEQAAAAALQQEEQAAQRLLQVEQQIVETASKRTTEKKSFSSYDDLRDSIAHVLGLQRNQVQLANAETASYQKLSATMGQLKQTYDKLSAAERESPQGKALLASIQEVELALRRIRQQASRPVSLENIIKDTPKTLDDMAYKMQKLQAYRQGIDLTKPNAANEIKQVDDAMQRLQKDMDKYMVKGKQVSETNNILGRSWAYMKNRLAFYFTVGATTQFVKQLIEVRSQYEMNEKALGILIDSAERGTQIFKELSEMSLVSPYTLIELSNAARQLTAYDIAAKDVVDTTRRLADMTASVGIPIERLTYAIGQVKAYGYLNARDARMFSNAGIPLVKQLSEYYTELEGRLVSTADVYDRINKKAIDYNDVMAVVNRMTDEGGKFFDYQAKMADTLKVQLANLTLAWNNMLNDIGKSEQGVLSTGIKTLKVLFLHWNDLNKTVNHLAFAFGAAKAAQLLWWFSVRGTNEAIALETVLGNKLAVTLRNVGNAMKSIAASPITWLLLFTTAVIENISALHEARKAIMDLNQSIIDAANERLDSINKTIRELAKLYKFETDANGKVVSVSGISDEEARKAWEMIREEIENTSSSSAEFVFELEKIDDVNKRVAAGFNYLKDIQKAQAALSQIDLKDIDVEQELNAWYNFYWLQDGLVKNFRDMQKEAGITKKEIIDTVEEVVRWVNMPRLLTFNPIGEWIGSWGGTEQEKYLNDLQTTVDSIIETMNKFGVEGNRAQEEFFNTSLQKSLERTDLTEKERLQIKIDAERLYFEREVQYRKEAIARETGDYKVALQQELDEFIAYHQQRNAYVVGFEKWLQKTQLSNLQETFAKMTDEEIKQLDFSKGEWNKWTIEIAKKFAEQNNLAIDDVFANLRDYVNQDWSVFIRLVLGRPEYTDVQKDFVSRTGYSTTSSEYAEYAKNAESQVDIVKKLVDAQKKKAEEVKTAEKAGGEYAEKNIEKLKKENEALITAIHSYNAKTQAEEEADKKKNKKSGGSKKDPVLDSLKEEIRLVEKLQQEYNTLVKSSSSHSDALATIQKSYGKTISQLNEQLRSHGLPELTTMLIEGKDPNKTLAHFQQTLSTMVEKGMLTLERSKEVEAIIEKLTISSKTFNLDKITKGLNSELDKLKDEYELSLELDANPELGGMFEEMFGIDKEALPRSFGDLMERVNKVAVDKLNELGLVFGDFDFDLLSEKIVGDEKNQWKGLDMNSSAVQELLKAQKTFRDMYKKNLLETEKMLDEYVKKYGDYSDKIAEVESDRLTRLKELNEAYYTEEMRKRPEYIAKLNAIEEGAKREKGKVAFDAFKNSRLYISMFEDLRYASNATLITLRTRLKDLESEMGRLNPEQLKQVTQQYSKIEQELLRRNPFKELARNANEYVKAAGKSGKQAEKDFVEADKNYQLQLKYVASLKESLEQKKALHPEDKVGIDFLMSQISLEDEKLAKLKEELDKASELNEKYNLMTMIFKEQAKAIAVLAQKIASNLQSLGELRDFLVNDLGINLGSELDGLIDGLTKVGQGINKIVSSAQGGDVVGTIVGVGQTVYGLYDGFASMFGEGSAKQKKIDKAIATSEYRVKQLEKAMVGLQFSAENAYGVIESGANAAIVANQRLQLAELKRQLELERSRKKKNQDKERILELEKSIRELQDQIAGATQDIINNLLGISSAGDGVTALVDVMIEAFRNGEDAMDAFGKKWDEMLDNMVSKMIVSYFMQKKWDEIMRTLGEKEEEYLKEAAEGRAKAQEDIDKWEFAPEYQKTWDTAIWMGAQRTNRGTWLYNGKEFQTRTQFVREADVEAYRRWLESQLNTAETSLADASADFTEWSYEYMAHEGRDLMTQAAQDAIDHLGDYYTFGENKELSLSNLQQGIQSITENTAGAIEAYLNSVSQQTYLQSDLLTQIRDAVVAIDSDAQMGIQAQMLHQLQQSYAVQMAIQGILNGWSNASGQAVRVEMI